MIPFSVLDLSPICEGGSPAQSFRNTLDLAQHAERWGFNRYWLAEHHNMPGIASAATTVVIGHVAAGTTTLRIGSGGIMLPNHAPLVIAEQFGTLAAIYGDRFDIGLGRAPGTDMGTARALRRGMSGADTFPQDVVELQGLLDDPAEGQTVHAIPGEGSKIPIWILGSSLYGAQLAAHLGLPYAFASHFAPAALDQAVHAYRSMFKPSKACPAPYFMLALNCFAAGTDADGEVLKSSMMQSFANLRTGRPAPLPAPDPGIRDRLPGDVLAGVDHALSCSVVGSEASVAEGLHRFIETYAPDEIILNGQIFDHAARLRSFEIAGGVLRGMGSRTAAE